jgi:YHS domain-containing protein
MIRLVGFLLLLIFLLTILRYVIGFIARHFFNSSMQPSRQGPRSASKASSPFGGELKRDPVCGTYVSPGNAVRRIEAGETLYFCSEECAKTHQSHS